MVRYFLSQGPQPSRSGTERGDRAANLMSKQKRKRGCRSNQPKMAQLTLILCANRLQSLDRPQQRLACFGLFIGRQRRHKPTDLLTQESRRFRGHIGVELPRISIDDRAQLLDRLACLRVDALTDVRLTMNRRPLDSHACEASQQVERRGFNKPLSI